MPLQLFGRELVLFRTEGGVATILDAHCPHMGAHVGYGGRVEGEGVRCPFHAWCFGTDGRCTDVPYDDARRACPHVGLRAWPVHETSGLILVHYSESGAEPAWHMPDIEEWGAPGWLGLRDRRLADPHARPGARREHPRHRALPLRPLGRRRRRAPKWSPTATSTGSGRCSVTPTSSSPSRRRSASASCGCAAAALLPVRFLTATTPIDDEHVDLRLLFLVYEGADATEMSPTGKAVVDAIAENTARDVPIWEHKVYREHPPLVAGDGPIGVLRKWARQFYET